MSDSHRSPSITRRSGRFLRDNGIALAALFVALSGTAYAANTIRSADIVDGEVKNADLGANAVTTTKVADASLVGADLASNTVTGNKIDESTLGTTPNSANSAALGGTPSREFRPGAKSSSQRADQCLQTGTWKECAVVTLTVPADTYYNVTVTGSLNVFGGVTTTGLFCAASEGPTCVNSTPSGFSTDPGRYTNASQTYSAYFGPGVHRFNTAVRIDGGFGTTSTAVITTNVRWHRYYAEYAN